MMLSYFRCGSQLIGITITSKRKNSLIKTLAAMGMNKKQDEQRVVIREQLNPLAKHCFPTLKEVNVWHMRILPFPSLNE